MGDVVRKLARALREDGAELGGPGPTPARLSPSRICVSCPGCGRANEFDPLALTRKLWNGLPRGDGEHDLSAACTAAYDAVEPQGWDARCPTCGSEFRLLYTIEEWGKMSGHFFPVIAALLYRPAR